MKQILYIATGNKTKLANFKIFFSWIDPTLDVQLVPDYIDVPETGTTLCENSKLKVLPYIGRYEHPVIANDSGLEFDKSVIEIQDPVKVKRNALNGQSEKDLSQQEISRLMFLFYKKIAKKYGGNVECIMSDVFSILLPDSTIKQETCTRKYLLMDRNTDKYDLYHPLNSLRISKVTGKFMDEMNENEDKLDKSVVIECLAKLISNLHRV